MTERPSDEQIADWRTWVDGISMNEGVDITPILDALVAERERADKAERQVATLVDQLKDYGLHARWVEPS